MSNEFFVHTGYPTQSADGDSVDLRAELLAIQAGFDKLPALATNAGKLIVVNPSADGLIVMGNGQENVGLTSWTPTLTCTTPGNLVVTYSEQVGQQYRVGGMIVTSFRLVTSSWTHTTASGTLILGNIPSSVIGLSRATGAVSFSGFTKAGYHSMVVEFSSNTTQAFFYASGSGVGVAQVNVTDFPTAGTLILSGTAVQGG